MTIHLSFLTAVALAGLAYVVGQTLTDHVNFLQRYETAVPLVSGLLFSLAILALRPAGVIVDVPAYGRNLDFLVGLLTANMGLHVTPKVLRKGFPLFLLFFALGLVLYVAQLLVGLVPAALGSGPALTTAVLAGPSTFIGAPFNLNPPRYATLLAPSFASAYPNSIPLTQGIAMIGALLVLPLGTFLANSCEQGAGQEAPSPSPSEEGTNLRLTQIGQRETYLVVLILTIVAAAFGLQQLLFRLFPALTQDHIPVIVLAYLLAAAFRLAFSTLFGDQRFYEKTLTHLLLGPTMSIVLTYALMATPLHLLGLLNLTQLLVALASIGVSFALARWLVFPLFSRVTDGYYAAVISTALFALTSAWGPLAMSFLRRYIRVEGPVEPMPVIMPLNAFYLHVWLAILLTRFLLGG